MVTKSHLLQSMVKGMYGMVLFMYLLYIILFALCMTVLMFHNLKSTLKYFVWVCGKSNQIQLYVSPDGTCQIFGLLNLIEQNKVMTNPVWISKISFL